MHEAGFPQEARHRLDENGHQTYVVVEAWRATYPDPIHVDAGETLTLTGRSEICDGHIWLWARSAGGPAWTSHTGHGLRDGLLPTGKENRAARCGISGKRFDAPCRQEDIARRVVFRRPLAALRSLTVAIATLFGTRLARRTSEDDADRDQCEKSRLEGWIPDSLVSSGPDGPVAREDYTAIELTCDVGDVLVGRAATHGWVFCEARSGAAGWVPARNLSASDGSNIP